MTISSVTAVRELAKVNNPSHKESKEIFQAAIDLAVSRQMASPDDIRLLGDVVRCLPEWPTVVQLGAGSGTLALGLFAHDMHATLFSVDIEENGHHYEMQALKNMGIDINSGCYFEIIADSAETGKQWYDGKVDMVIVDASHVYEDVRADIEAWMPHVNGFFFVHDYDAVGAPRHYSGVKRACDELLGAKPLWQKGWSAVFDYNKGMI